MAVPLGFLVLFGAIGLFAISGGSGAAPAAAASCVPERSITLIDPPKVSPTSAGVGTVLKTTNGKWTTCSGNPITYTYEWVRGTVTIAGATSSTYTVTAADAGYTLHSVVTADDRSSSLSASSNTVPVSDTSEVGPPESDQSPPTGDETTSSPAAPTPMSPQGPVPTDLWSATEVDSDEGVQVVSSTALGTAGLTGVVQNAGTAQPIAGAAVTLSYTPCGTCAAIPTTTTTDSAGSFAFINMPAPQTYSLSIGASGYGLYNVVNDAYDADSTYSITAALDSSAQTFDESQATSDDPQATNASSTIHYSMSRVPPSIRVARVVQQSGCTRLGGPNAPPQIKTVTNYSFDFYVLHVLRPEVGILNYHQLAMKAFESLVQNFAWYHKTRNFGVLSYDVDDSTTFQCFRPHSKVNSLWRTWLRDVLDERIVDSSGLKFTGYRAGASGNCTTPDPTMRLHGGLASQRGIKVLEGCYGDWRPIATVWYSTDTMVDNGLAPKRPTTSFDTPAGGQVTLHFASKELGVPVAWTYQLEKLTPTGWHLIRTIRWRSSTRSVPTSATVGLTSCTKFRVRAGNPVGFSDYSSFNSGNAICP
jgi:hypothetical protein